MTYFLTQTLLFSPLLCYGQKYILVEKELRYFLHYKSPLHDFLCLAQQGPKIGRHFILIRTIKMETLDIPRGGMGEKCILRRRAPSPPVLTFSFLSPHFFDPVSNLQGEKNCGYGPGHGLLVLRLFSYISKPQEDWSWSHN